MDFVYDDGGRKAAGRRGQADDCVVRAIAIAMQRKYSEVYDAINETAKAERYMRGRIGLLAATGRGSSARTGVHKPTYKTFLSESGWVWTPTMQIGAGCRVHLRADELPTGRLIVSVSRHLVAVIDGSKLIATSNHADVLDAVAKIGRSAILLVDRKADSVIIYL